MRSTGTTRRTEIVCSEQFLEAWLWRFSAQLDQVLEVNASKIVKSTNPLYVPVHDYLARQCFHEINRQTVDDPQWVFGTYTSTEYMIFAVCPGKSFEHNCVHERKESVRTKERVDG